MRRMLVFAVVVLVGFLLNTPISSAQEKGSADTSVHGGGPTTTAPIKRLVVISPYSKPNFVDHSVTDQSSIIRFIEDNWQLGQMGDNSFDAIAGTIVNVFNFPGPRRLAPLILDPTTGEPSGGTD
jgi:phospholipase C